MTLPIIERPLYGDIILETTAWTTPFSWVDRTADLVAGINYSEGGRLGSPGVSPVDVGTLNATFKNAATVPAVGDLVRLRRSSSTSALMFTGYVQDVSQQVVFDQGESFNTPIILTTIHCVDWVGYVSQFQAVGAGGNNPTTYAVETDSSYLWSYRVAALNYMVDNTGSTEIIDYTLSGDSNSMGDTDIVGTYAEHLDLISNTTDAVWYGVHTLPTNKTTGRTGLVDVRSVGALASSGKTFTDEAGTAGQLHYTEIDFENSTQNVANSITVRNRVRFWVPDIEVTRIGGFNESNYMVVNGTEVVGVAVESTQTKSDATSISTYGIRQAEVETNATNLVYGFGSFNIIANPSMEYSDDGYTGGATNKVRRRKPLEDANPFASYNGEWAMRSRTTTATATHGINYSGGESDGIPVKGSTGYYVTAYVARGTVSRGDVRARIDVNWYNESEALISTTTGSNTTLTTANTWYRTSTSGYAAPATAVRATINVIFTRSGGGNHSVGDNLWADALMFSRFNDPYYDGDTSWDSSYGYIWTGGVGASPTYKVQNIVDDTAADILARYSTTTLRTTRIRWNAQEDLTALPSLTVGSTVGIRYDGTTTTYRIVGIDGTIDPDRYMVDYYVQKV